MEAADAAQEAVDCKLGFPLKYQWLCRHVRVKLLLT